MQARNVDLVISHFPTRRVATLIVRLARFAQRSHSREDLAELLWPGAAPGLGRNRLRHALSTLARLLDTPGMVAPPVLLA